MRPPKPYNLKTIYFFRDDGTIYEKEVGIPSYTIRRSKNRSLVKDQGAETSTIPGLSPPISDQNSNAQVDLDFSDFDSFVMLDTNNDTQFGSNIHFGNVFTN